MDPEIERHARLREATGELMGVVGQRICRPDVQEQGRQSGEIGTEWPRKRTPGGVRPR
jgi:hypothetical protein